MMASQPILSPQRHKGGKEHEDFFVPLSVFAPLWLNNGLVGHGEMGEEIRHDG